MTPADTASDQDRKWFEKHPNKNFRLRSVIEGEHEQAAAVSPNSGLINADGSTSSRADIMMLEASANTEMKDIRDRAAAEGFVQYTLVIQMMVGGRVRAPVYLRPMSRQQRRTVRTSEIKELVRHQLPPYALAML